MPTPSEFNPIILFSEDLKLIHAAAVAGDTGDQSELAEAEAREARLRRRRLDRRLSRLKPVAKNALIRDLATILYGADLDPQTEWTQDNVEQVADRLDVALKLRG